MSDIGPDEDQPATELIDLSGTPRSMGDKRDYAFQMMKAHMLEVYGKKMMHVSPMIKGAKMQAYNEALTDAFNVFCQIVEVPTDEELSPG